MDNPSVSNNVSSGQNSRLSSAGHDKRVKRKFNIKKLAKPLVALIFVALIVGGGFSLYGSTTSSKIDGSKYQAVFLTNGKVYFGKLKIQNGGYVTLTSVYYLLDKDSTTDDIPGAVQVSVDADVSKTIVQKRGEELHGPEDEMIISVDQVLFFENLKSDGMLSRAITQFESENN